MSKIGLVKSGVQLVVGYGAGLIADNALELVKPKNLTGLKKVAVKIGAFTISALAADKVTDFVEHVWDETEEGIRDLINKPKVVTEEEMEAE